MKEAVNEFHLLTATTATAGSSNIVHDSQFSEFSRELLALASRKSQQLVAAGASGSLNGFYLNASHGKKMAALPLGRAAGIEVRADSVEAIMKEKMNSYYCIPDNVEEEDAFFVGDMGEVIRQFHQWKEMMPRVEPFYAMKCCPDPVVMETLVKLGTGFDCASRSEIESAIALGVSPSNIIYANPCKQASHLRYAASVGVKMMTFDNADELRKIAHHVPDAQVVLRILGSDGSRSLCNLGLKFGAAPSSAPALFAVAKEVGLRVVGVSFHVGSGCFDAKVFGDAVRSAAGVMDIGRSFGFEMSLLDIGGGFPCNGADGLTFKEIVKVLKPALETYIPKNVRIIAEPGRYFAASAFTLAVNVVARRVVSRDPSGASNPPSPVEVDSAVFPGPPSVIENPAFMYYVNDGMYGSFNCITFDHATVKAQVLAREGVFWYKNAEVASAIDANGDGVAMYPCSIWGPTCDSIDCIEKEMMLPELNVGDWMVFENMGAYTLAAASRFNGFKKTEIIYTNTWGSI